MRVIRITQVLEFRCFTFNDFESCCNWIEQRNLTFNLEISKSFLQTIIISSRHLSPLLFLVLSSCTKIRKHWHLEDCSHGLRESFLDYLHPVIAIYSPQGLPSKLNDLWAEQRHQWSKHENDGTETCNAWQGDCQATTLRYDGWNAGVFSLTLSSALQHECFLLLG